MAKKKPARRGAPIGHKRRPIGKARKARSRAGQALDRLKAGRLAAGKSQADAAAIAGINIRTYQSYESGELPPPRADVMQRLAEAFGTTIENLL